MESEIPEDIMDAARVLNMQLHGAMKLGQRTQWIAEAILSERERCASVAERYSDGLYAAMAIRGEEI